MIINTRVIVFTATALGMSASAYFLTDIRGVQRMFPNDFEDPVTFHQSPNDKTNDFLISLSCAVFVVLIRRRWYTDTPVNMLNISIHANTQEARRAASVDA